MTSNPETVEFQGAAAKHKRGSSGVDISRTLATGDLNGDGIADLVVASYDQIPYGAVHIVFGRASGPTNVITMPPSRMSP